MTTRTERCKSLVAAIETLSQTEIEEMFKMIHKRHKDYTRNNNGVFINLTWVNEELLQDLENYVCFCIRSRSELQKFESLCDVLNSNSKTARTIDDAEYTDTLGTQQTTHPMHPTQQQTATNVHDENVTENVMEGESLGVTEDVAVDEERTPYRMSSSARFTMLKKRYSKQMNEYLHEYESDLKPDRYVYTT
jgi:hypothetical protein